MITLTERELKQLKSQINTGLAASRYLVNAVDEQTNSIIRGERSRYSFNKDIRQAYEEALSAVAELESALETL